MKPIGSLPTSYGVSVPVYFDRTRSANEDDCYFHDIEGCMTLAGVYGTENRERCRSEIKANLAGGQVAFGIFLKHGGRKVACADLARPASPVYPRLPHDSGMDIPIENWVTLVLDYRSWNRRAAGLLEVVGSNLDNSETWAVPQEVQALALAQMLTASLEHLTETELDCIEAAAMYALTLHFTEWSKPAVEWLAPMRGTWFRDWIDRHPQYARFAKLMRWINPELPAWIAGGET